MKNEELWVVGPGESLNKYSKKIGNLKGQNVLAFQNVFPNCYEYFNLIPNHWICADPNAFMQGFEFLDSLEESESGKFKKMQIIIPHFMADTYLKFRTYCGTSPLGRKPGAWEKYSFLLDNLKNKGYNINIIDCTTTKYIKLVEKRTDEVLKNLDILNKDIYARFMYHKPIFGTVEYDSESVSGDKYKWGLENKLSSAVFPICYYLGAKKVYIAGFDLKGGRFYDPEKTRHPWNDETQKSPAYDFPLGIIKKWSAWKSFHNMDLVSVIPEEYSLLNKVLKYEDKFNER